ncbi:MAG: sodium-independent anion transporter [Deltaproteobacteria bacterium]|nr:MAG: sodium-independent anion transporter [Deltaproteobacteria bacterium]
MISKVFPFLVWFKDYNKDKFKIDFLAGITVALVLIPQSMAYAQLAGLPAYFGLYAAFLPPMIASLFGSSRQLATGPVAVVSLMSAASLEPLATAGSAEFIAYSILLALTVGIFQFSLGVLRLGLVVNFLSHPVVNGFTNAAAIIIATSQFPKFFGVYIDKAPHHYETMLRMAQAALDYTHLPTLLYGVGAVAIMVTLRKVNPRIPNVLVAVAITTIISALTGFHNDKKADITAIQLSGIEEKISEFNYYVNEINTLGEERARPGAKIDEELKKQPPHGKSIELIRLQSEVDMITNRIDFDKHKTHMLRKELRRLKFTGVNNDGQYIFYPKDAVPAGEKTDGKTWRLKVGNKVLDPKALTLSGGGAVVGEVPKGLPPIAIPEMNMKTFLKLLPTAIIISLLGFMEAIAIAKAMAAKTGQKLDPNQELIGQGLANILGSVTSSYSVSGSFSRSAVNLQAGAVSGISSVVTSLMVVITLLFFTPLLYHLPQAVLAAVIMMAVIGLVNIKGFIHAWHAQRYDGIISVAAFLITLYYAPHLDKGIMVGVAASLAVFLYKTMRPVVANLRQDGEEYEEGAAPGEDGISIVRFDGPIFFANASYLDEKITALREKHPDIKHIIVDASGINGMDASGEEALGLLVKNLADAGLGFGMCRVKKQVIGVMKRTGLYQKIGGHNFHASLTEAVKKAKN